MMMHSCRSCRQLVNQIKHTCARCFMCTHRDFAETWVIAGPFTPFHFFADSELCLMMCAVCSAETAISIPPLSCNLQAKYSCMDRAVLYEIVSFVLKGFMYYSLINQFLIQIQLLTSRLPVTLSTVLCQL